MTDISSIRNKIMKQRGIHRTKRSTKGHTHLSPTIEGICIAKKTTLMKFLELQFKKPIEDILTSGSLRHIEDTYHIDFTTASKWRKLLFAEALKSVPPDTLKYILGGLIEDTQHERVLGVEASEAEGDH